MPLSSPKTMEPLPSLESTGNEESGYLQARLDRSQKWCHLWKGTMERFLPDKLYLVITNNTKKK